jgi:hypothetical protein
MGSNTYITSSGTQITASFEGDDRSPGRVDARTLWFNVNVGAAPPARIPITFEAPDLISLELQTLKLPPFAEVKTSIPRFHQIRAI